MIHISKLARSSIIVVSCLIHIGSLVLFSDYFAFSKKQTSEHCILRNGTNCIKDVKSLVLNFNLKLKTNGCFTNVYQNIIDRKTLTKYIPTSLKPSQIYNSIVKNFLVLHTPFP